MANNWNPNAGALGLEWWPTLEAAQVVGPAFDCYAQQLRSTVAETITRLDALVSGDPAVTLPLVTVIDIMAAGSEVPSPGVQTAYLLPNQDVAIGTSPNDWVNNTGGATNLFADIDNTPVTLPIDSDSIHIRSTAVTFPVVYRCRVDPSAIPANARILNVSIVAVDSVTGPDLGSTFIAYALQRGSTVYYPPNGVFGTHVFGNERLVACGEINPNTGRPWTPADIADFNIGGNWQIRVEGNNVNGGDSRSTVWKLALKVDYLATDNREAYAVWNRPAGAISGIIQANVFDAPSGAANWAKPSSGDFLFLWRSAFAPLVTGTSPVATDVRWRAFYQQLGASGSPPGLTPPVVPGMRGMRLNVDQYGLATDEFDPNDAIDVLGAVLYLRNSTPAYSNDSQTYSYISHLVALSSALANGIAQRFTPGSSANYLGVRFLCYPPVSADNTLTVTINRVSDGVQMGGSLVLTADDVRALPTITEVPGTGGLRYVQGNLSSAAALVAGTQYELRFVLSSTSVWSFLAPESDAAAAVSFGGSTDTARSGGTTLTEQDLEATVLIQPAVPTNVRARVLSADISEGTGCQVGSYDQIVVEWDVYTTLGSAFDHFEIERITDNTNGGVWLPVANIPTDTTISWTDIEPPLGVPVAYRLRAVADSAAFSDWVTVDFLQAEARGCEVVFTSNARRDLTVAYETDGSQPVQFDFLDHAGDEAVALAGRDHVVVFTEPEDRGMAVAYRLTLNFGQQPVMNGRIVGRDAVFEALRRISRAVSEIPYVCVRDHYGNVYYAHITLSRGVEQMPGWRYYVDVAVRPVTGTPAVVDS